MAEIISPDRQQRAASPGVSYLLGAKIYNQPLAMPSALASQLKSALDSQAFDPKINLGGFASKFIGARDQTSRYRVTDDGVALVPVSGVLLDRGDWLGDLGGWATSYEGLAEQFRRLAKDAAIKTVVLDIDSGGGMVAGLWDCCAELAKLKKTKKVYAVAANMAASAAYAIGCAAHQFYVSRSGVAGSIGVVVLHQSIQRLLDAAGVDTTIITAGEHKADGNMFQQLSHGARSELAAEIDRSYDQFVAHVVKHRSIDDAAVRATQARVYSGQLAVAAGLADGVKSIEDLLEHIRAPASATARGQPQKKGGRALSDPNTPAAEARPDYDAVIAGVLAGLSHNRSAAAAASPVVPIPPAAAAAPAAAAPAAAAAKTDEKARISAILGCEAAKTRGGLAHHLALETDLDAATAEAILAKAPAEAAAEGTGSALERAMAKPGSSAGIKPAAEGAAARQSFSQLAETMNQKKRA